MRVTIHTQYDSIPLVHSYVESFAAPSTNFDYWTLVEEIDEEDNRKMHFFKSDTVVKVTVYGPPAEEVND